MIVRGIASKQTRDLQDTVIVAGAFDASISRRGVDGIAFLLSHDAKRPAGRILSLETRDKALHITARLDLKLAGVKGYLDTFRAGETLGFSIAARDVKGVDVGGLTFVSQADLYEISLTKHPVNPECLLTFASESDGLWPPELRATFAEIDARPRPKPFIPTIRYEATP